ncbi:MAG TPA: ATP-binding cassette domain-containing protein, partial [Acidimicrobiales bacterium]
VLFDVSLQVADGEALALLGTNGAGKSTLLRLLCGLERPSAGAISFEGRDITTTPAERLVGRGLALISGGHAVFPDLTVRENLDIQALPIHRDRKAVRARTAQVLDTFPVLQRYLRRRAGTLSGGEQQQLALAKALLLDPKVLCIDELSLGLAPVVVKELMAIVRSLRDTGITLVIVEQSLSVACEICERAVFMEKGEIRFEGAATELLERDDIARAVFLGGHGDGPREPNSSGTRAGSSTARSPAPDDSRWARPSPPPERRARPPVSTGRPPPPSNA